MVKGVLRRLGSRRVWAAGIGAAGLTAAAAGVVFGMGTAHAAGTFDPKSFGAQGNGTHNDGPAIQAAVDAANSAGGGIVHFTSGKYLSAKTIHLHNNITIQLDGGATILGNGSGYDAAESNPNDKYQDYGHSHFHDAMFYGDGLQNVQFVGSGTIDGNGKLITGNPGGGQADKIISLTNCKGLVLSGITLARGGHFGALINGCDGVTSDGLTIATGNDRDGWNIINTSHITITNITDTSNDDALVFKSDWALGKRFTDQGHVLVDGAHLKAGCCNALMFGSETCSNFTDYTFKNITITGASKSGIGIVSMDGANISNVHYSNITMSGVASPIMEKISNRKRCGDSPGIGTISNITFDTITGTGKGPFSPTIFGFDATHRPNAQTFTNVNLTVPGGSGPVSTGVPSNDPGDYNPKSIGTRPAYGWYIHQAANISYLNSSVRFQNSDARPAVIADNSDGITFDGLTAQKGTAPEDVLFNSVTNYCVTNSKNTSGGALKVVANSSTQASDCSGGGGGGGGGGGLTISNLSVADTANAADWSVQPSLATGVNEYGDRTITLTSVPSAYAGKQWIRTANDSKAATNNPLVTFTVNQTATVAVAVDTRIGKPSWMGSSWADSGAHLTNNEGTPRSFEIYTKSFPAGSVPLGPNGSSGSSNYVIIVF